MKNTFPIMHVLMSSKDYNLYANLFRKIKLILIDLKVKIDFKNISFMSDFEKGLRKALNDVFSDTPIYGCYFHFVKNIWDKSKKFGLFKKASKKNTYIIIFAIMKMYPYIMEGEKDEFLDNMEHFIKNINNKDYFCFLNILKKFGPKQILLNLINCI